MCDQARVDDVHAGAGVRAAAASARTAVVVGTAAHTQAFGRFSTALRTSIWFQLAKVRSPKPGTRDASAMRADPPRWGTHHSGRTAEIPTHPHVPDRNATIA